MVVNDVRVDAVVLDRPRSLSRVAPWVGKPLIKVLTGQRRIGESCLLQTLARTLAATEPRLDLCVTGSNADASLAAYLRDGGLPFLRNVSLTDVVVFEYLSRVANTALLADVVARHQIRNPDLLGRLVLFLADNVGSPAFAQSVVQCLKSQRTSASVPTILAHLSQLAQAFLIRCVRRSDLQGKRFFEVAEKHSFEDLGQRFENLVGLDLCRQGTEVSWDETRARGQTALDEARAETELGGRLVTPAGGMRCRWRRTTECRIDREGKVCGSPMRMVSVEVVVLAFDRGAPKRATNLSFNADLLRRAKALGINLSARLEPELIRIVADEEQRRLAQELAPSVAAWAAYYETHSAVVDDWSEE